MEQYYIKKFYFYSEKRKSTEEVVHTVKKHPKVSGGQSTSTGSGQKANNAAVKP